MSLDLKDPVYRLHSQCKITDGPLRSVIIDLDRRKYETIPNGMFEMLMYLLSGYPSKWSSVVSAFGVENEDMLIQYREWLLAREYIHEALEGTLANWPPLPVHEVYPDELQDGIIDLSADGDYPLLPVIRQFEKVRCKSLMIRDYDGCRLVELRSTLSAIQKSIICNIHLFIRASAESIDLADEFAKNAHITIIIYHGCTQVQAEEIKSLSVPRILAYTKHIQDESCCGKITPDSFTVNHQFLSASGRANTCLDRKLSIDRYGHVKNCPSMAQNWGRAENFDIISILGNSEFRKVWSISKSQITTCKVCEFRDVCSDCRAYTLDPGDLHSKPAKCNYDPYTATWNK